MTLDATVGGATANSYLTLAAADAMADEDFGRQADAWKAAAVSSKEAVLKRATREISSFLADIGGARYSSTQALLFPRAVDVAGNPALPYLPITLLQATYQQATYVLENAKLLDDANSRRARGLFSYSNPDGTGGSIALDPAFGRLSPDVEAYLVTSFRRRAKIASVRILSSIEAVEADLAALG
jgi:hypothetical protein